MTVIEHERDPDARRPLTDAMTWGERQRLWMRVYKRERDRFEAERDEARQQLVGAVRERDEHRRVLQEALKGLRSEFRTARVLTAEQVERHLDRTGGR